MQAIEVARQEDDVRVVAAMFLAALSSLLAINPAHADWPSGFVRVTCIPKLSYFSIQRFIVYNIPTHGPYLTEGFSPGPEVTEELRNKYKVYDSSEYLEQHPVICSIPPVVHSWEPNGNPGFEVKVTGRHQVAPGESSYRHMIDEVDVFVNEKQVGTMGLNPYGLGTNEDTISIAPNGLGLLLYTCSVVDKNGPNDGTSKLACIEHMFKSD